MKRLFAPHNAIYVNMLGFLAEKPYLCREIKRLYIMAIEIKPIPVLHGKAAARFVEEADRNAKERRGSIDFTKHPNCIGRDSTVCWSVASSAS